MKKQGVSPDPSRLAARLSLYRRLSALLAVVCVALAALLAREWLVTREFINPPYIESDAPHAETIEKLLDRVRYSGSESLMNPATWLHLDFASGTWELRGLRRFDADGDIRLDDDGKRLTGVCNELAVYAYQQLKPHFPESGYRIEFIEAYESSYFQSETGGRHVILRIADLSAGRAEDGSYKKVYVLDPALRRYGTPDHFDSYVPVARFDAEPFVEAQRRDPVFRVDTGTPILITRFVFVSLSVEAVDGRYDAENYRIALSATRRYRYNKRPVYVITKREGHITVEEPEYPVERSMGAQKLDRLKRATDRLHRDLDARLKRGARGA